GGALILVPLLVALGEPVLLSIGLGQVIQLPIAAIATLANLWQGQIDLLLGGVLALTLSLGIAAGVPLAHKLPQAALRRLLALTMLAAGIAIAARLVLNAA
ncbi:MAG TPA: sulfite exporter TauE/SafE family protein, partial [Stellaceae bacterium]|nr:sulfite exporter TauE/SafE family protein [Stellaceae bacterium]